MTQRRVTALCHHVTVGFSDSDFSFKRRVGLPHDGAYIGKVNEAVSSSAETALLDEASEVRVIATDRTAGGTKAEAVWHGGDSEFSGWHYPHPGLLLPAPEGDPPKKDPCKGPPRIGKAAVEQCADSARSLVARPVQT